MMVERQFVKLRDVRTSPGDFLTDEGSKEFDVDQNETMDIIRKSGFLEKIKTPIGLLAVGLTVVCWVRTRAIYLVSPP
jgi:hypothetical protein